MRSTGLRSFFKQNPWRSPCLNSMNELQQGGFAFSNLTWRQKCKSSACFKEAKERFDWFRSLPFGSIPIATFRLSSSSRSNQASDICVNHTTGMDVFEAFQGVPGAWINLKLTNSAMCNRIFTCNSLQSLRTGCTFLVALQTAICKSSPVIEAVESLAYKVNTLAIMFRCYVAHRCIPLPLTKHKWI